MGADHAQLRDSFERGYTPGLQGARMSAAVDKCLCSAHHRTKTCRTTNPTERQTYSAMTEKKICPSYWSSQFPDQSRSPNVTLTATVEPFTPPDGTVT